MDHYWNCFIWFYFAVSAKIDEVIIATGDLQPLGDSRPIMSPVPGVVSEILVKEGELVESGSPLLRFDPDVNQKRKVTLEEKMRLEKRRFEEQENAFEARVQSLHSRIESQKQSYQLERTILAQIEPFGCWCRESYSDPSTKKYDPDVVFGYCTVSSTI